MVDETFFYIFFILRPSLAKLAIVKKDEVESILNHLNALYPNQIKFTVEREKDGCLAFLDLMV